MTGKKWCEEYNRIPKLNAQKLIALVPFGPVQVMYDICDTEYDSDFDGERFTDDELMAKLEDVLISVRGEVADGKMRQLMANLPYCGVYIDDNFVATNSFGGYICRYDKSRLHLYVKDGLYINPYCKYALSVNNRFGSAAKFGTICHELAHLLCGHLNCDERSNEKRKNTTKERDFEAETVAWIVCKRLGIELNSAEYLALYAEDGQIPYCSLDNVMRAVSEIEEMMGGAVKIKESFWYKRDKDFRKYVDDELTAYEKWWARIG